MIESLQGVTEFLAASGSFQVEIIRGDALEIFGLNLGWLAGCEAKFIASGDVRVYVDLSDVTEGAVEISDGGHAVTVTAPQPQFSEVELRTVDSYVFSKERGVWQRFAGLFGPAAECVTVEQILQVAEVKIVEAARESDLLEQARINTEKFVRDLVADLGFGQVDLIFESV